MGRVKRTQKTRTVNKQKWNSTTQSYDYVPVVEAYWEETYVSGNDGYGGSYDSGSCSSGGE